MRPGLLVVLGLVVAVGAVAAVIALGDGDSGSDRASAPRPPAPGSPPQRPSPESSEDADARQPPVVLVRRAQGTPSSWVRRAESARGVERVVRVRRGQALLKETLSPSERVVEKVRSGYAIPLDTIVADTRSYASMLSSDVRRDVASAGRGEAVLSETGSRLRRVGVGGRLDLEGGAKLRVAAVVEDGHLNGAEMLIGADRRGVDTRAAFMLVRLESQRAERGLRREFRGERVRIVGRNGGPPGTRRGRIARPAELKVRFGEVAVGVPIGDDVVRLDPRWVRRNIREARVPILGSVTCNRRMVPALRGALLELERRDLSALVDRGDYAGCYAPRRIPNSGSLSLHALGLAVDFNASTNGQYRRGNQDPRLVRVMEEHGFTWGGRWPTARDPMHFEFQGVDPEEDSGDPAAEPDRDPAD